MAFRIIDCATTLAPFGDAVAKIPFLDTDFEHARAREVEASQVEAHRLTFADYAFASAPALADFARSSSGQPQRLAVKMDAPIAAFVPVSSAERRGGLALFDVYLDAPSDASLEALRASAAPSVLPDSPAWRRELPRMGPPPHFVESPATGNLAFHLEHWVHLLWAAPAMVPRVLEHRTKDTTWPNRIAKSAKIHPSAQIDGSFIGEGVEIGAGCTVIRSYLGPGSKLSDSTKVGYSVLGENTHTLADGSFYYVVSLGGGTLANFLLKDTVLGKDVFITSGVTFWTDALDGEVMVQHGGQEVPTGRRVLGGCAGHRCVLGARTIVAPGRTIPNETTIVMRSEEGVKRVDAAPPGTPMAWYDGRLVPVSSTWPEAP